MVRVKTSSYADLKCCLARKRIREIPPDPSPLKHIIPRIVPSCESILISTGISAQDVSSILLSNAIGSFSKSHNSFRSLGEYTYCQLVHHGVRLRTAAGWWRLRYLGLIKWARIRPSFAPPRSRSLYRLKAAEFIIVILACAAVLFRAIGVSILSTYNQGAAI